MAAVATLVRHERDGMLLRFRVANVRSLREEQELSFVVPEEDRLLPSLLRAVAVTALPELHQHGLADDLLSGRVRVGDVA
jgi:hypothetical protein